MPVVPRAVTVKLPARPDPTDDGNPVTVSVLALAAFTTMPVCVPVMLLVVVSVAVNDWLPATPEAPFGGMKQSGLGRECGLEGFEEYTELKTVFIGGLP